jgi:hypothetical protein
MTPVEVREVLVEDARWWASRRDLEPAMLERAREWLAFFEQLYEDDPVLVMFSVRYQNVNAFRHSHQRAAGAFGKWNMYCRILQKLSQTSAIPRRPD